MTQKEWREGFEKIVGTREWHLSSLDPINTINKLIDIVESWPDPVTRRKNESIKE